jgi:hypothetical protein
VKISALALLKMVMHARSGGKMEVMGVMQVRRKCHSSLRTHSPSREEEVPQLATHTLISPPHCVNSPLLINHSFTHLTDISVNTKLKCQRMLMPLLLGSCST